MRNSFFFLLSFVCLVHCRGSQVSDFVTSKSRNLKANNIKRMVNETGVPPSRDPMEDDLYRIRDAFMFPGSYYLVDLLHKYIWYKMETGLELDDMKEYFELPECDIDDLMGELRRVSNIIDDTELLALHASRLLIKPILKERMRCPAHMVDVSIAKALVNISDYYMDNEDITWYNLFLEILPQIDPQFQPYARDIANQGVQELHGYLFGESIELLFTFGLRDVAFTSHRLHNNLMQCFQMEDMQPQERKRMFKESVRSSLWDIWCPDSYHLVEDHRKIVTMFRNEFEMIEHSQICPLVGDFLYRYVVNNLQWYNASFENTQGYWMLCDVVGDIIKHVVERFKDYENFLLTMNIGDLENVLQKYLSHEDWYVFTEALQRLGFTDTYVRSLDHLTSRWLHRK